MTTALAARETLRLCTAGSVDDGKSTFVGRLLHDTKSVLADQLASVAKTSADRGFVGLDLSLLVDGLRAEREQGITIDVAYRYFATDRRAFILADTPGHVQYTRNTVTGVSTSQVVVVLIDVRHGVVEQTRRHLTVAGLLGITTVIVAVNKVDLVDYSEDIYRGIEAEVTGTAVAAGISDVHVVPISALLGDNVAVPSENTPWYEGPTVIELLETIDVSDNKAQDANLRFPIQYVIRDHASDYRGYAGRIATGSITVGEIVHTPSGIAAHVTQIDTPDGPVESAPAGSSVTLVLDRDIDLVRGDLITNHNHPESKRTFEATVVGLSEAAVRANSVVNIRYGTAVVRGRIDHDVTLNQIERVRVELAQPLPVEPYNFRGAVGSFLIIDPAHGDTLAAGLVE
ncbi:sulfate adenylyltransferase subunit 1 [Corynebacterium rouxii]|uniref:sulfate adenylyltransferase n=1 Tax=Corynebacterium rouxii TaxID=2719119 RepID=A0ABU3PPY8_9CORY|nr:GTP-binding protein [Corynebacterium rouxii]MDT9409648.1 GTP-binding protein [Corynebacterium rouxii]MDT9411882.1 GTP-binding protein [Corynebacterium rouxii]